MVYVDVQFPLVGCLIPVDHGYHLYSAVSRIIPELHSNDKFGLHPVSGILTGDRSLRLTERSHLTIRLPSEEISTILPLAGKKLNLGGNTIQVGVPRSKSLVNCSCLYSRLVVIKGFMEPEGFLEAVKRQLEIMAIEGKPALISQPHVQAANINQKIGSHSPFLRRTIRIKDKEIVGFALRLSELSPDNSIRIQAEGIGGRRRFGCGIFIPDRRDDL